MRCLVAALLAAAVAGVPATSATAADEAAVLRQRAEQLAGDNRCDEALPRARRARELSPQDARAALVEGSCLLRIGSYREAIGPLEDARRLDPTLPGVSTDLAQCHYHTGDLEAASRELDRALQENPDDARAYLYRGLVLNEQANDREAAAAFDRAGGLDPGLAPVAGLYAGRSWASAQDREKAVAALERARSAEPGSEWALAAERELQTIDDPYRRHVWAQLSGGVEYDSNVNLRQSVGVDPITGFYFPQVRARDRDDVRAVFDGEIGAELLRDPDQSLGAVVGYDGDAHASQTEFDLQYPWLTLWYDRRLGEKTWLRLQPFGGYAWLGYEPFVAHGGGAVSLFRTLTENLTGRVYVRANGNDFRYDIETDPVVGFFNPSLAQSLRHRRDRDGVEGEVGVEGSYWVDATRTSLTLGTAYERYWADGNDWDLNGSRTWLTAVQDLPWSLQLEVTGRFSWHPYEDESSYDLFRYPSGAGRDRNDKIFEVDGELSYPVTDWLEVSLNARYSNNDSNIQVFDFDRWIAGGLVTVFWSSLR